MDTLFILAIAAVLIVLLFDYTNGFHDAANPDFDTFWAHF
jgi:PiT family inorganic phosphate transporter